VLSTPFTTSAILVDLQRPHQRPLLSANTPTTLSISALHAKRGSTTLNLLKASESEAKGPGRLLPETGPAKTGAGNSNKLLPRAGSGLTDPKKKK
jgi:hypothetical protein